MLKNLSLLALFLATFTQGASVTANANSGASATGAANTNPSELLSKLLVELGQGNVANMDKNFADFLNGNNMNPENVDPNVIKNALSGLDADTLFKNFEDTSKGTADINAMDRMMAQISGKTVAQIQEERKKAAGMIKKFKETKSADFQFSDLFNGLFNKDEDGDL